MKNLIILIFVPSVLFGQSKIDQLKNQAETMYRQNRFNESLILYQKLWIECKRNNLVALELECIFQIANCHIDLNDVNTSIKVIESNLKVIEKLRTQKDTIAYIDLLLLLAYDKVSLEDYNGGLKVYEKAIDLYEKHQIKHHEVAYAYKNASQLYFRRLDYVKSINYLEKAIRVDTGGDYKANVYALLSSNYVSLGELAIAEYYYNEGLAVANDSDQVRLLNLAKSEIELGYGRVGVNEIKVISEIINSKKFAKSDSQPWWQLTCVAAIFEKEGKYKSAKNYYKKALSEVCSHYTKKSREKAKILSEVGGFYARINHLDSSLNFFQQALLQLFPRFNSTNIADNPPIKDVYTESWIMTAAAGKAGALLQRYAQRGDLADLHNAAYCYDLSLAAVKELHKSYGSDAAKLYMGDYSHDYWENAIEVNYQLYSKTGNSAYLEKAFSLMENSKASILSEAIQKNRALLLAGIPDSLLEAEKDLRFSMGELSSQLRFAEVEGPDAAPEIAKIKSQFIDAQLRHERLLEQLKHDYPGFKSFVEDVQVPSIKDVSLNLLVNQQVFLEFFAGDKAFYCLIIEAKGARILKMARNAELNNLIGEYLAYFNSSSAILNDQACFFSVAHELYKRIFPALDGQDLKQKLVLVPDGILGFLPFDALVTNDRGAATGFGTVDFLIKKHELSYAYSANVLLQQLAAPKTKGIKMRVMPRFGNKVRGLAPLSYSEEETAGVKNWQSLDGELATKAAFIQWAEKCRLIHLSTHAESVIGEGEPYIEMADERLMLSELYALNLTATDLVILSACETGLGKVEKGEGVMSLARGFAYAGANSLIASLWKVNERSTATLFAQFYQYLAEGKTKSEALQLAKIGLLENAGSDARQSPYYWAGFVFMGSDGKMDLPRQWQHTGWLIGGIGLALGAAFFFRRRWRKLTA